MSTTFTPLADRVVFKEVKIKDESEIILLDGAKSDTPSYYEVVAVGPGRIFFQNGEFIRVPLEVQPGDRITLTNQATTAISAHNLDNSSDTADVLFSVAESYIAGVVNVN